MSNIHLINQVRLWEQRLKIENEKVANLQGKPYTDAFSDPQPVRLERVSVLSRILKKKTHTILWLLLSARRIIRNAWRIKPTQSGSVFSNIENSKYVAPSSVKDRGIHPL
jgi:hypothetical protein